MRRTRRRSFDRIGVLATAAALALLSSCGGSDGSGVEFPIVASESINDPTMLLGFGLAGTDVTENAPVLTAAVGEPVTIVYENKHGQYSRTSGIHDFAIVPVLDDLETLVATRSINDHVLWGSAIEQMPSGGTDEVTFTPTEEGTYLYICTIPGHTKQGMFGEFIVESPDAAA